MKKIERWTYQAYDQGSLLAQPDLAMPMGIKGRPLPTRGNINKSV